MTAPTDSRSSCGLSGATFPREFAGAAFTALLLLIVVGVGSLTFGTGVTTSMLISATAVIGLQIFSGNSGITSFGHAGFVALGAYVSGILTMSPETKATVLPKLPSFLAGVQVGLPVALIITALAVGFVAILIGYVIVRLGGYAAAIASLGVLVIVHALLLGLPDITRGAQTFYGIEPLTSLWLTLVVAIIALFVARLFRGTSPGLQLRASREDELAAQSFGVNIKLRRLQAWTLAAIFAALAGGLLAHFITAFSPKQFYFALTFSYIVMLIIGGFATVSGAIAGTVIVVVLSEVLRTWESGFQLGPFTVGPIFGATQIVLALLMLLIMYFRRNGLLGLREPDELLLSWLQKRRRPEGHHVEGVQ